VPRLEHLLHSSQHLEAQRAELGPPMVDGGQAHGTQDSIGHRARPGNLQEVAAAGVVVERDHGGGR
jgi:hypothetical protein